MRRILNPAGLALALALAGTVTGVEVASPAEAATPARGGVAAAIDGPITRAEIIERAQSWVDVQPGSYSRTEFSPDRQNSRGYRRDCAGFVDMAWHLGADHWTGTLPTVSTPISRSDLAAGDILLDAEEHVILFHRWEPDRVHFSYYSFGPTSTRYVRHASIDQETLDGRPNGDYRARRYKRVVEGGDPGSEPAASPAAPSTSTPPSAAPSAAPAAPSASVAPSEAPTSPSGPDPPSWVSGAGQRR